jgi:hypothetical protein
MIRTGADKIKRIEASLGIVEGQINSSGEYASFSNIAKAASKRMDLSTAQNQQEYVENMVKQITPEEYASNQGLFQTYTKLKGIQPPNNINMDDFLTWLFDKNNVGFLNKEIIIKEQHNCRSTKYWENQNNSFLMLAHEYIFVFQK